MFRSDMPLDSYPFLPAADRSYAYVNCQPYPVVGKAVGIVKNAVLEIVIRDGRYRMGDTLLPNDVKERVAAGDVEWDGFKLTFL